MQGLDWIPERGFGWVAIRDSHLHWLVANQNHKERRIKGAEPELIRSPHVLLFDDVLQASSSSKCLLYSFRCTRHSNCVQDIRIVFETGLMRYPRALPTASCICLGLKSVRGLLVAVLQYWPRRLSAVSSCCTFLLCLYFILETGGQPMQKLHKMRKTRLYSMLSF